MDNSRTTATNPLQEALARRRIEIKYLSIAACCLAIFVVASSQHWFDGLEEHANALMERLADYGPLGMFLIAAPSNMTLVIQMPYNLTMFTLILYADSVWEVIALGMGTGIGAGVGGTISYGVARVLIAQVSDLEQSRLFQWVKRNISHRPRLIPWLVWLAAATPLPDLVLLVPVALSRYPWRRLLFPMLIGKAVHNIGLALLFYYGMDSLSGLVSHDINLDFATIIVLVFGLSIAYQVEKARDAKQSDERLPA